MRKALVTVSFVRRRRRSVTVAVDGLKGGLPSEGVCRGRV